MSINAQKVKGQGLSYVSMLTTHLMKLINFQTGIKADRSSSSLDSVCSRVVESSPLDLNSRVDSTRST